MQDDCRRCASQFDKGDADNDQLRSTQEKEYCDTSGRYHWQRRDDGDCDNGSAAMLRPASLSTLRSHARSLSRSASATTGHGTIYVVNLCRISVDWLPWLPAAGLWKFGNYSDVFPDEEGYNEKFSTYDIADLGQACFTFGSACPLCPSSPRPFTMHTRTRSILCFPTSRSSSLSTSMR